MKRILPMMIAALLAAPLTLHAQRIDSPYRFLDHGQYLGVHAGYGFLEEGRIGAGPQAAPAFGIHWALRVSGPFAIGAEVGYIPTTRTVRDTVFDAGTGEWDALGEADVGLLTVMGNLRVNLTGGRTWNSLQPFLVLGAGVAVDLAGTPAIEAEIPGTRRFDMGTSFAGEFGAGVDWFLSPRMSVRLDARNVLWQLSVPEDFRLTEAGRTLPGSEWERNLILAAGLSFHF